MRVTIHQPEFMPWLGFFHKASLADVLVLLDDAQFTKNYFHNRNRVRTKDGWAWVTVPVEKSGLKTAINEVRIAETNNPRWREKIKTTFQTSYGKAPYFEDTIDQICTSIDATGDLLISLNIPVIEWMLKSFGLFPTVLRSSDMGLNSTASQRILDICLQTRATTYISGVSGLDYLDLASFKDAGIAIEHQEFHHPIYPQLYQDFVPQITAIEAIFQYGPQSAQLLAETWPRKIQKVFA